MADQLRTNGRAEDVAAKRGGGREIRLWDHVRYGLVNAQMLKALLHVAKTTEGAKR